MAPGFFGNEGVWRKVENFFRDLGFKCSPITLPYRVKFAKVPNPKLGEICEKDDMDFLLTRIAEIKKTLAPGELFVGMGYSRGALLILKLQQIFAEKGEKLFDKIVLIAPAPPRGISALSWPAIKAYLSVKPLWKFWQKPVRREFASMAAAVMEKWMPDQDKKEIFGDFSWESGRVILETLLSPPKIDPKKIGCPALVVAGTYDLLIPPPVAKKIATMFSADYREVKGAHFTLKGSARKRMCELIAEWIFEI
ncbi:MAG: alpha/beta hydrolase [Patescibacteria group bacterium]|nr:alpha/beta hydrolase [Patescibacteria group bacterium]